MPTTCSRARKWISTGKATGFFKKGVFCVRLNHEPSDDIKQEIAVGIDPGSKREAYTVKSNSHTYLNILSNTPDWIKDAIEYRRSARKNRRFRNTRYREARFNNRTKSKLPPSTKARWQLKLNISKWLCKIFPITIFCIEDIKAKTKGKKKWDKLFSPLEVGKNWFYNELGELAAVTTMQGWETKLLRDTLLLKKSKNKLADKFECHNVDSWVLANNITGGHSTPDNKEIFRIIPIQLHRRQLHYYFQFSKNGIRSKYGSTRSMGFKRGSLISHKKYGLTYVGGTGNDRISVHSLETGKRLAQNIKTKDCYFLSYSTWRSKSS